MPHYLLVPCEESIPKKPDGAQLSGLNTKGKGSRIRNSLRWRRRHGAMVVGMPHCDMSYRWEENVSRPINPEVFPRFGVGLEEPLK